MTTFMLNEAYRVTRRGPTWTVSGYCVCGAGFRITTGSEAAADAVADAFVVRHQGEGHGSTDAAGAYRARVRAERAKPT